MGTARHRARIGRAPRHCYQFHIATSREQAIREAAPHYEENMKMFGELRLVWALTNEQIAAMRDPKLIGTVKLPTIGDAVKAGGFSRLPARGHCRDDLFSVRRRGDDHRPDRHRRRWADLVVGRDR